MNKKLNFKLLVFFTLINCLLLGTVLALIFRKPQFVKVNKIEFLSVQDSLFNFRINLAIKNSNFFSISGRDLVLKLSESGQEYGEGSIDPFCLTRSSQSELIINMNLNYRRVLESYAQHTSENIFPSVLVTGSFMPGFFINKINLKKNLTRKDVYSLLATAFSGGNAMKADSFSIKKLSALESVIDFNILFTNNFNFDYTINQIKATLYPTEAMKIELGKVILKDTITCASKHKVSIPLHVNANNFSILKAIVQSGLKDLDSFFINGEAMINVNEQSITIPFSIPYGKPSK
jgi:LEA14-like dessication related protein